MESNDQILDQVNGGQPDGVEQENTSAEASTPDGATVQDKQPAQESSIEGQETEMTAADTPAEESPEEQAEMQETEELVSDEHPQGDPVAEETPMMDEAPVEEAFIAEETDTAEEATISEEATTAEEATTEPDAEAEGEEELSDEDLFLAAMSGDMPEEDTEGFMFATVEKGQIVEGTVARITNNEVLIDVGAKTEGMLAGREIDSLSEEIATWEVGQPVTVYVLNPEDRNGNIILSVRRAQEAQDWESAAEYMDAATIYETDITGFNKGGLLVKFGLLRGFIPASQISSERRRRATGKTPEERFGEMVGEPINVKVIEVNKDRNRLILSERAASRERREARRAELLESLEVGEIRKGRVTTLTDFGAFVDLGGIDGLIHISQLDWAPVNHPRDVLKQGDEVTVEVINVDRARKRIGLSRKTQLPDPWQVLARDYNPDQLVQGEITKLTNFGAFARLLDLPAVEGLVHISELAERRVGHPSEVVHEGQVLTLRIIRIEQDRRRLGLSLKRVGSTDYIEEDLGDWRSILDDMGASDLYDDDDEDEDFDDEEDDYDDYSAADYDDYDEDEDY